jgi:hypothetical protein
MQNILRLIVGTKRRGKTTLAQVLSESRVPRRLAALDPTAEDYPDLVLCNRLEFAQTLAIHKTGGDFAVRMVPQDEDDVVFFCKCVLAVNDLLYIVDEGGLVTDPRAKERAVYALSTLGGHWEQDGIWVTQMPTSIPKVVRSQADEIYFFMLDEVNDVEWARNYLGDKVSLLGELPKGECLRKTRGEKKIERIRVDIVSRKLHIIEV